jgi:hypothetical protein
MILAGFFYALVAGKGALWRCSWPSSLSGYHQGADSAVTGRFDA